MNAKKAPINIVVSLFVLVMIWLFLLYYFQPALLFLNTTVIGGDMGAHNLLAHYLRNTLLPDGKILGWFPYHFAGLPLFQFYFLLPYFIIAILSYVIPFNIAFKLVTLLGIFFLPITAFLSMRLMRFRFPIPPLAALICLFFLFRESGIAAGGTIKSALAGQFAYSLSVALMILALGLIFRAVEDKKYVIPSGLVIAAIVLSHPFGLIPLMTASTFFIFEDFRNFRLRNSVHLAKMFGLGFFLSGIWSIPYLFKRKLGMIVFNFAGLTSSFNFIKDPIFWIPISISIFGILLSLIQRQRIKNQAYTLYWFTGLLFFTYISDSNLLFVRFHNVLFLFALITAVSALASVSKWTYTAWPIPLLVALIVFNAVYEHTNEINEWIKWNYEGLEKKTGYPQYQDINAFFAEKEFQGRIDFEYDEYSAMGSPRVFELSPMFHGKPVMEGLLFESSITYPFFFYMQREVSEKSWWPGFPIRMPNQNMANGMRDFKLFNVHYFVAKKQKTKEMADAEPLMVKEKDVGDMRIYRVDPSSQYVEPLRHEPVLVKTDNWRPYSFVWMGADQRDKLLVFTNQNDAEAEEYFPVVFDPRKAFSGKAMQANLSAIDEELMNKILSMGKDYENHECLITEQVTNDRIVFTTNCIGRPHLIKMSYFPNWKVKGAKRIYQASPSLMMVVPESKNVEIYYGYLPEDIIGILSTLITLIGIFLFYLLIPERRFTSYTLKKMTDKKLPVLK